MRIRWEKQNEEVDADGFFFENEADFAKEMAELAKMGAPDTDKVVFVSWEATDRDAATFEADAPDSFAEWVLRELVEF